MFAHPQYDARPQDFADYFGYIQAPCSSPGALYNSRQFDDGFQQPHGSMAVTKVYVASETLFMNQVAGMTVALGQS
jgi:hypothetical protein